MRKRIRGPYVRNHPVQVSNLNRISHSWPGPKESDSTVRVLVTSLGATGHVHPLLPLATALHCRGNDVRFAVHADQHAGIERHGLTPVAAGLSERDRLARLRTEHGIDTRALPHRKRPEAMFPYGFGLVALPAMAADLRRVTSSWRPDVVIHDAAEVAGKFAAEIAAMPTADDVAVRLEELVGSPR